MKLIHFSPRLVVGLFFSILSSLFGLIVPLIVRQFINLKHFDFSGLSRQLLLSGMGLIILNMLVSTISAYLISSEGDRQVKNLRTIIQSKVFTLPQSYFDHQLSGNLTSRIINDVGILRDFLTETIPTTITGLITIIGTVLTMLFLDWRLTIMMILLFPADAIVTIPLGHINEKITNAEQASLGQLTALTSESLKNIKTLKLNNAESLMLHYIRQSINRLFHLSLKTDRIAGLTGPLQSMLSLFLILIVILYGALRVKNHALSTGTLGAFMMYFFQVIGPVNDVATFYTDEKQMIGATHKIQQIMQLKPEKKSLPIVNLQVDSYQLTLRNVSFAYYQKPILKKINFKLSTGEKVALVGATGAGKSTLVNLITRLYVINQGQLLLNQQSACDFNLQQWRQFFSVVSQENTILTGTIRVNLTLGLTQSVSDQQLWEALQLVQLKRMVTSLPNQLDAQVGEQGLRLSGGQRQRLQIARAFLRPSKFLILDEATSSLDADTEKAVMAALDQVSPKKKWGQLIIAHHLATITDCDRIYFLKNRKILAVGTHKQLFAQVPDYRRYVKEQELKEEENN